MGRRHSSRVALLQTSFRHHHHFKPALSLISLPALPRGSTSFRAFLPSLSRSTLHKLCNVIIPVGAFVNF